MALQLTRPASSSFKDGRFDSVVRETVGAVMRRECHSEWRQQFLDGLEELQHFS